ncbi:MAG: ATP synthase A1 subunit C [Coriobacteriia bacterium]|nr:ATP synthase A1 subunit C [Coriobacteriia bacterium]MBN2823263.1 ATP synthase A1 subunit C [Coriobacteriia bacterium]
MSAVATLQRKSNPGRDYGYSNARVRGMRARLFTQAYLDDLMASKDISDVIQVLMQTEYGPDLEERLLHGRTAQQVDEALKDNMVRKFRKVLGLANDEAYGLMIVLLGRWDLFNVKTILRGIHMSLSHEEIEDSLIAVGQLSHVDMVELAKQPSVKALVDTLATWELPYAVPLRAEMAHYNEDGDLSVLELALDKFYTAWADKSLRCRRSNAKLARRFLGVQVDTINLLTCLRLLNADVEAEEVNRFYLPGGLHVKEELFSDLASMSDVDEVYERLKRTPYGRPVEAVAIKYVEHGSVSVFERALEDYLMRRAFAAGQGEPLGVGIIIGYMWAKANEVTNLRIIVKGVSVGMPVERIKEELIIV